MSTNKRPTTCGALWAVNAELGEKGCKRLPRHGGEHRAFRTEREARKAAAAAVAPKTTRKVAPKGRKATLADRRSIVRDLRALVEAPARGRVTAKARREMMAALSGLVEKGKMSAGDALGVAALF